MAKWVPAIVMAGAAVVAFGAAGLFGHAPRVAGEVHHTDTIGASLTEVRTIGVGGCASAGCHGGSAVESLSGKLDERTWNGSASHWLAVDPHTQAYAALKSELAEAIMKRFAPGTNATDDVRCLACHTNPSLARADAGEREKSMRADGVSCEACHGDAGKWMPRHTAWSKQNRAAMYDAFGMAKLFDIGDRALACAGCHVGAPADETRGYPVRDMNHDMIAAGHPRLNFDFADSQHRLPPHWFEEDRSPEFEVKSWLVGRAACAEAGVMLKADRASRGKAGTAPMPEFADWSCVSCHHKIGDGYPTAGSKPRDAMIWPRGLNWNTTVIPSGPECAKVLHQELQSVVLEKEIEDLTDARLDSDTAGQVFYGLAARERMRMKRENRVTYDPRFDKLKELLTQPRGNLDFRLKDGTADMLIELLKR